MKIYVFKASFNIPVRKGGKKPWRKIAIHGDYSLYTLAKTIVRSFDFCFDHCFGFYDNLRDWTKSRSCYDVLDDLEIRLFDDESELRPGVKNVRVREVFKETGQKMLLIFNYRDEWQFIVKLEEIKNAENMNGSPELLGSYGNVPDLLLKAENSY